MNRSLYSILFLLVVGIAFAQTGKLTWKAELEDNVKRIQPVQNGRYLFLSADEHAWLYENATGKKVWSVDVNDYTEKGVHRILNDSIYLVANDDSLFCFSMIEDTLLWKRSYTGIEQDRFSGIDQIDTLLIVSYGKFDLGISLLSGKELWRTPIVHQSSLKEKGSVSSILLPKQEKILVFTDDDECILVSSSTGKKLLSLPKSEPNGDLVEQHRAWYYLPADQRTITLILEKNVTVIDLDSNRILTQQPLAVSEKYNVFVPTVSGCVVIGEEKLIHINSENKAVAQMMSDVDDLRALAFVATDSGTIMIVSRENMLTGIDLTNGKQLWQSAPKSPSAMGFIHRAVAADSNNIVVTYLDPSDDVKLYLLSLNALNGTVNFRTLVAHSDESLPERILPLPVVAPITEKTAASFGFENAGFSYEAASTDGIVSVLIHSAGEMIEPNTKNEGGEGLVMVDIESGKVTAKNYMKIADGLSFKGGLSNLAPVKKLGNIILLPGEKKLVALDATTGAVKWMHIEQDLSESFVHEMFMVDTILYLRTGGYRPEFTFDEKKNKLSEKKLWEDEGYSIIAVDTADGKIHWMKRFEEDPGRIFLDYSIEKYMTDSSAIFAADEKFMYSFSSAKKGALNWKFEFSDSGIGSMDYASLYRISTAWRGETNLLADSSRYGTDAKHVLNTSGALLDSVQTVVSKVLHANYSKVSDRLFVIGDDGMAAINTDSGKMLWFHEWDYDEKSIAQRPIVLKDHLFYAVDGKAALISILTGKKLWSAEIDKEAQIYIMPDRSSVIAIEKDEVNGFVIP